MAALSSVDYAIGALSSQTTGTVMTINAVAAVAGTPAANAMTVQPSSITFSVAVSSGTLASLSSGTVAIGNAGTVAAVKAANTAASSLDPALAVSISPNSINPNGTAVSSNSAPVTIASNQVTLAVAQDTSGLTLAGSSVIIAPSFVQITASASGNTTIVSSASGGGKRIRVLSMSLTANGTAAVQFQSGAPSSAVLAGPYFETVNSGFVLPFSPVGWFQTASSEGLVINISAASTVGGSLTYITV